MTIYGERIRQARELSGLTQKELAEKVGVAQSFIAQLEASRTLTSDHILGQIAEHTDVKPIFFDEPPSAGLVIGSPAFRAQKSAKAVERNKAFAYAGLCVEQVRRMSFKLNLPALNITGVSKGAVEAARAARVSLGFRPDRPIPNLINAIERQGVMVIALPFALERIDAFSMWASIDVDRPVVVVSSGKPGDRLRFSVAHEMGHILLHKGLLGEYATMEHEANQFAGELLLPAQSMRDLLTPSFNLLQAARLKLQWGVSIQVLVKRAADLNIITRNRYRYLFQQVSASGWKKREPANLDIPVEKPRAFTKMVELCFDPSEDAGHLASAMRITRRRAEAILEGYSSGLLARIDNKEEYVYSERRQNLN